MKSVLFAIVLAIGTAVLVGCSSSNSTPAGGAGSAPPQDSGAGAKKGSRIPAPTK
ncbi:MULTISPECIES: hypothetical protein [Gemmata]|uniref:Uncharacterized protein n=1 Tax=Gemmata massiliana TaxID=1210884 RepID=A0A6P2CUD0_9BACT|nr:MULTISPECIES: hypothetical protein [Gemmata]VTR91304.1 unnamed protein product [Gemmata massiliana]